MQLGRYIASINYLLSALYTVHTPLMQLRMLQCANINTSCGHSLLTFIETIEVSHTITCCYVVTIKAVIGTYVALKGTPSESVVS